MGEKSNSFRFNHEETVPTYTIGAAFILSIVLGLIVISGVLYKPYEARKVVEGLHEKIMMQKEYRELSKMSFSETETKVKYSKPDQVFPESKTFPTASYALSLPEMSTVKITEKKTDRAQNFDRNVKSEEYWKSLQASVSGASNSLPGSAPVVIPPVVVGSAK